MSLPLDGITVVEVSSFAAAPLCGVTLAQLGAEVIRVDPIGGAADFRRWPLAESGVSIYWTGLNKGKRSAAINLRSADGQQLVQRLIVEGDGIVVTNAVGLDWLSHERLAAMRPDVISVQLLGRGDGSTGVDYTVNAAVGFPYVTGPADHAGPSNLEVTDTGEAVSALAEALGADFSSEGDRYRYRAVLSGLFSTWFAEHSASEITDALSATTVLFERYRTFAEVAADDRVVANPLFTRMHQPGLGDYFAPGLPLSLDGRHPASAPAPTSGEDTAGLLAERLGLSSDEITRLGDAGTIACEGQMGSKR